MLMERVEMIEEKIAIAKLNGYDDLVDYYKGLSKEVQEKINKLI